MEFFNANATPEPIRFYVTSSTIAGQFSAGNGPGGLTLGAPTGGDMGLGTINATGYYINGVALGGGGGTVTSVGLSGGTTGLTVSGSPVTTSGTMTLAGTLAVANGGTGATTAGAALTNLGAAPLASPALTGVPTAPTATVGTNTTQIATTAFVLANAAGGAFLPLAGGQMTGNIGFSNAGKITGNMSGTPRSNRFAFQDDGTAGGGLTNLGILPPTGSQSAYFTIYGSTDVDNATFIQAGISAGTSAGFTSNAFGTGTVLPFSFVVGSTAIMTVGAGGLNLTAGNFQVSGANFGGTCTGGQFVSAISAAVIPTCATPAAGSFAPLTNPAGGQNNYAPLASPTFTGTVTLPDSSTVASGMGGFIVKNDPSYAAIFFQGTITQPKVSIQMQGPSEIEIAAGQHVNNAGTTIADAVSSAAFLIGNQFLQLDFPSSSTVGSAVTHNYVMQWSSTLHALQFPTIIAGTAGTGGGSSGGAACFGSTGVLMSNAANCIASSLTLKTDIRPLDGALATIEKLAPAAIYYRYKQGTDHSEQPGFGAETVAQIDPRYATFQNGKPAGVRYEQMAATEAAAIAEQQKEIEELKAEVKQLRGR
jgi:hypothetical protein